MIMTTPSAFLQFAEEMGLERIKSSSISNHDGYATTGLTVLNNLCRLIEQIQQLKAENHRLRAHLELVDHVEKFQQHFLLKDTDENKKDKQKPLFSSISMYDEEKSDRLSPTNSLKTKRSLSDRDQKGKNFFSYPSLSSKISIQGEKINHNIFFRRFIIHISS